MNIEIKKSIKPINYFNALNLLESRLENVSKNMERELIWTLSHNEIYTAGTSYNKNEIIDTLKFFKIETFADKDNIGIWYKEGNQIKKVAAIGVRVKKWIAYHGFAININNNLDQYKKIIPCGISNKGITNLIKIKNNNYSELENILIENFILNLKT